MSLALPWLMARRIWRRNPGAHVGACLDRGRDNNPQPHGSAHVNRRSGFSHVSLRRRRACSEPDLNPAVTLGLAVAGRFSWKNVVPYWIARWWAPSSPRCSSGRLMVMAPTPMLILGFRRPLTERTRCRCFWLGAYSVHFGFYRHLNDNRQSLSTRHRGDLHWLCAVRWCASWRPGERRRGNPARALGPMLVTGAFPVWFFYTLGPLLGGVVAALVFRLISRASAKKAAAE